MVALATAGGAEHLALASTVVLVRPPRPSAVAAEATIRLRGELVAAGFEVRVIERPDGEDMRASLELAATGTGVEAVVAITGESPGGVPFLNSAELWVIDRVTGKTVVRRVPSIPGSPRAAEVLSIRALELLRASFLEVALASNNRTVKLVAQAPPTEVTRWTREALRDAADWHWALEIGASVLRSRDGMPPSFAPTVRVERRFGDAFIGRVTLAGLGTPAHLETQLGTADVTQNFGLVEGLLRFRSGRSVQPFLSAGVGGLYVSAKGHASTPYHGFDQSLWAVVADAGAGLRFPIRGRFELSFDAHAQFDRPYPVILFNRTQLAQAGRPTLLGSISMIAWM